MHAEVGEFEPALACLVGADRLRLGEGQRARPRGTMVEALEVEAAAQGAEPSRRSRTFRDLDLGLESRAAPDAADFDGALQHGSGSFDGAHDSEGRGCQPG